LAALCFFWGTTYLGIRIALESFGPATLVCLRNLASGTITLAAGRFLGAQPPRGREMWGTALIGVMIIGVGNGTLSYAEQWVPSGLASLMVASSPFWFAAAEAAIPGGARLSAATVGAMVIGSLGTLLLLAPAAMSGFSASGNLFLGFLLLQMSQASWSIFSIVNRRRIQEAHPIMGGAIQQLATGVAFAFPAWFEHPALWTWRGVGAILYLAIFGGVVGYGCYSLVMARLPVAIASIYTYVNPVVAVILGWMFYREPFGRWQAAGMAVIFLGVALVRRTAPKESSAQRAAERR
jgi:drug/metabolite transporter (DMT)-like permease